MNKNKLRIIVLMLFATSICQSYTETTIVCRVNNSQPTIVSCEDSWVRMRGFSEVEIRLKDCLSSWSRQNIEVRIDNTTYRPNSLSNLELSFNVDQYSIKCVDGNRLKGF